MKKEYRLNTYEFLRLQDLKQYFSRSNRPIIEPMKRFNLGFGIFGLLEQCSDGKYMEYDRHEERMLDSERATKWKEYKHLEYKDKVEGYLVFKERRIIISTFIIIGLLCLELSRLF